MSKTLAAGTGRLYRVDPDFSVRVVADGIWIPNSIAWSPDWRTMYFADSHVRTIFAYDFDLDDGAIGNRRVFAECTHPGVPDGSRGRCGRLPVERDVRWRLRHSLRAGRTGGPGPRAPGVAADILHVRRRRSRDAVHHDGAVPVAAGEARAPRLTPAACSPLTSGRAGLRSLCSAAERSFRSRRETP